MEKLFFGIDGGGTKSRLGIMNAEGTLLHTVTGSSTNMYAVGFETACFNIRSIFKSLQSDYGIHVSDLSAGCFASAGVSTEIEQKKFREFFIEEGFSCPLHMCADAFAALAGGTGKAEGLILISGTGSIAAGLRPDGKTARAGGLGHLISDEGSGFAIALAGIRSASRALEGRAETTRLTDMLFEHYKAADIRDLFSFLYTDFSKARVASFCPCVFDAWRSGDAEALRIIDEASKELSLLAQSVYVRLFSGDDKPVHAVFSGGIFEHEVDFSRRTAAFVHKLLPCVTVRERLYEPVHGACILAKHVYRSGRF
ncbi:BadF/BadG/BcrA/BcrD ATPase family protein [Treponema sp. HNW]|uniref:BadF/BadG/BcrA/BcrD ATPase family protein n=1 Tax=Treponema sp. HNW TaxID=3116654 RepID=UPI003D09FD13